MSLIRDRNAGGTERVPTGRITVPTASPGVHLYGPKGDPGQDGKDGANGRDGVDGRNGVDGAQGPPGESIVGPPGPAGPAGAGSRVVEHVQFALAATWTIVHSLGTFPSAVRVLVDGKEVLADVEDADVNTTVVVHAVPLSGRVVIHE